MPPKQSHYVTVSLRMPTIKQAKSDATITLAATAIAIASGNVNGNGNGNSQTEEANKRSKQDLLMADAKRGLQYDDENVDDQEETVVDADVNGNEHIDVGNTILHETKNVDGAFGSTKEDEDRVGNTVAETNKKDAVDSTDKKDEQAGVLKDDDGDEDDAAWYDEDDDDDILDEEDHENDDLEMKDKEQAPKQTPTTPGTLPRGKRICPSDTCDAQISIRSSKCPVCSFEIRKNSAKKNTKSKKSSSYVHKAGGGVPGGKRICPSPNDACNAQIAIRTAVCPECEFVITPSKSKFTKSKAKKDKKAVVFYDDEDVNMEDEKEEVHEETPRASTGKNKNVNVRKAGTVPRGKRICPSPGDTCTALVGIRTAVCPECEFVTPSKSTEKKAVVTNDDNDDEDDDVDMNNEKEDIEETPRVRARKADALPPGKRVCPSDSCDAEIWISVKKCPTCSFVIRRNSTGKKKSTGTHVRRERAAPRGKRVCPSPGDACTAHIGIRTRVCPECGFVIIFGPSTTVHKVIKSKSSKKEKQTVAGIINNHIDDDMDVEDEIEEVDHEETYRELLPRGKRICPSPGDTCTALIGIRKARCPECQFVITPSKSEITKSPASKKELKEDIVFNDNDIVDGVDADIDMKDEKEEVHVETPRASKNKNTNVRKVGTLPRGKRICPSPNDNCAAQIAIRTSECPECEFVTTPSKSKAATISIVSKVSKITKNSPGMKGRRGKRFCPGCAAQVSIRLAVCSECNHRFVKNSILLTRIRGVAKRRSS